MNQSVIDVVDPSPSNVAIVSPLIHEGQEHFRVAEADLPADDFRGRIIDSVAEAVALIPAWKRLMQLAVSRNPYFDPSFLLPAMRYLGEGKVSLLVIEASQRNRKNTTPILCGVIPVVFRKVYGIPMRTLEIWKHDQCFDCTPLIRADCKEGAWRFMLEFIHNDLKANLFSMNTVLGEGDFSNLLTEHSFDRRLSVFHRDAFTRACFKPLDDEETYLRTFVAKSTRKGTLRLRRKLEQLGELNTEFLYDYDAQLVSQFLDLEASGWKGTVGTALASKPTTKLFFEDMMQRCMRDGNAVVVRVTLDKRPIAMLIVLQQASRAAQFKIAFDEQFKEFTPGTMVEFDEIRRMFADAIEYSDSCADPNHSMINRVWGGRVRFQSLVVANDRMLPRIAVALMPIVQQAKHVFSKSRSESKS
ncbi:MAG: GNAT family N-acetyltransferase [Pirellulaceae bacterium]